MGGIEAGQRIDKVWLPDDTNWLPTVAQDVYIHVTPWFGYGINHCYKTEKVNVHLELDNRTAWAVATRKIPAGEELLANYNEAFMQFPFRVMPASPTWVC